MCVKFKKRLFNTHRSRQPCFLHNMCWVAINVKNCQVFCLYPFDFTLTVPLIIKALCKNLAAVDCGTFFSTQIFQMTQNRVLFPVLNTFNSSSSSEIFFSSLSARSVARAFSVSRLVCFRLISSYYNKRQSEANTLGWDIAQPYQLNLISQR